MDDLNPAHDAPSSSLDRRTVVKAMAWTAPVIAGVAAAPLAAASVQNAGLAVTGSSAELARLKLLDANGFLNAKVALVTPKQFTIYNGAGALTGTATVTIVVSRPTGVNISLGKSRGLGVYKFNGNASAQGANSVSYPAATGFPITTFVTTLPLNLQSNASLNVPVEFGLVGVSDGVTISALATFPVAISVALNGRTISTTSQITVPVGAGVL